MNRRIRGGVLVLGLVAACTSPPTVDGPRGPLERGIFFVEETGERGLRGISSSETASTTVTRVPDGWPIDPDSRLLVRVDPSALASGGNAVQEEKIRTLVEGMTEARDALQRLERYLVHQRQLLGSYAARSDLDESWVGSPQRERYVALRTKGAEMELAILAFITKVAETDPDFEARAEEAAVSMALLVPVLEELIASRVERYNAAVRAAGYDLRIEALLYTNGEVLPVHVPGYDTLEEGRVVPLDRRGLSLVGRDGERFRAAFALAQEVAEIGNRVLDEQLELKAAFEELQRTALAPLVDLVTELQALGRELDSRALAVRAARTRDASRVLLEEIEGIAASAIEDVRGEVDALRADLAARFEAELALGQLLAELAAIRVSGLKSDPGRLVQLVTAALASAEQVASAAPVLVEELRARIEREIDAGLANDVGTQVRAAFARSALLRELDAWRDLAARTKDAATRAVAFLKAMVGADEKNPIANLPTPVAIPELIDVELSKAPDTRIRLRTTPRAPGDSLRVRASLIENKAVVDEHVVDFSIDWLGWSARLDPAVVLARPDESPVGDADFRFATSISWLWTYTPHPDQTGTPFDILRFLRPGIGPHAVLLPFDPDETVEIGLGATLTLWDGVLQGGVGSNLMDDGDLYTFVGTSLIPLLQVLGNALPGGGLASEPAR